MDTKNVIKTSMQKSIRYICAILLLVGMSGSVWGTTITASPTSITFDDNTVDVGIGSATIDVSVVDGYMSYGNYLNIYPLTDDNDEKCDFFINNGEYYYGSGSSTSVDDLSVEYIATATGTFTGQIIIEAYNSSYEAVNCTIPLSVTITNACSDPSLLVYDEGWEDKKECYYGSISSFELSVNRSGSGAVSWISTNTSVATVSGDASGATVTIVGAGDADIEATVAANGDYCSDTYTYALLVNPIAPTLSHNTSGKELTVSSITSTGATFTGGVITNKGGQGITRYGFTIGTSSTVVIGGTGDNAPVASGFWDADIATNTAFGSKTSVSNFSPNTTYYVRAFAYNGSEYGYSTAVSFTTLQRYAVTYKINDGSATADEVEYKDYGVDYTVSSDKFSRSGYTLVEWNTSNDGSGTGYDKGATYSTDAALTLYAVWGGTVSFDANGGTESMDAQVVVNGGTCELPECGFTAPSGKFFKCWTEGSTSGTERDAAYSHTVDGDITFYAKWRDPNYTDFVFSCSELTLTAKTVTDGTPIFITSAASKTVRSQDSILIVGSGLTPGQALEFPGLNAKFTVKSRVNGALSVKADGTIDTVAYIFYNPGATTEDGLDKMLGLTVKVGGAKPKQVTLEHNIIGRHLPADFVIAAKRNNKWYALPDTMSTLGTPKPIEIAVDDIENPSVAYTASTALYGLEGPTTTGGGNNISSGKGQYIRFTMTSLYADADPSHGHAPLFGSATKTAKIGKSGTAQATSDLSAGYWWKLVQKNTSITNAQDAKYQIFCANNDTTLSLKENAGNPIWGLYKSGIDELRIIPASDVEFTESEVVVWAQKKLILEIAKPNSATQARAMITDGSWSTNKSLATTTGTSVKGSATKYNYTLDFTSDDFDFAANEGKMLIVELLDSESSPLKASSVLIPRIIAADRTINNSNDPTKGPWNTEVHVLPGVTLTLDASAYAPATMTIKELNVYPGATVIAEKGTLIATTLVLRNGWNRLTAEKEYNVARLFITPTTGNLQATNAYSDWYIDYDQYYPIAVPWEVTTGGMRYMNTNSTVQAGVTMKYYDGASRAANVQSGVGAGANWKAYSRTVEAVTYSYPETLKPGHGYAMTARRPAGKAFSIIRMPLTIPSAAWTTAGEKGTVGEAPSDSHKDTVQVYAYGDGSTPEYAKGWNFIANPYMSVYAGELSYTDAGEVQYANIPDINFREYDQLPIETTKLKPSSGFLIQAPKDGTVTFGTTHRAVAAPAYRTETPAPDVPTQKAYIRLNGEEAEDMMGLIVDEQYTAAYEANADLQKLLGDGTSLRTYLQYDNMDMAFLAVNSVLAQAWIPVTVRIPTAGAYTYSMHYASRVGELEGVYLMDYLTGQMTNLLDNNYTFTIEAGTTDNRFALNAIVGERQLPTDMDVAEMTGGEVDTDHPVKFIYHDQVYILYRNCIYDATGKQVRKMNR